MKIEMKSLLGLFAFVVLISACGQQGPLYLPGQASTLESMAPGPQPATTEESEEESEEDAEEQTDNIN